MKKYKILTVAPFFPPDKSAGLVNHIVIINTKLMERGHDVTIIAPKHVADKRKSYTEEPAEHASRRWRFATHTPVIVGATRATDPSRGGSGPSQDMALTNCK